MARSLSPGEEHLVPVKESTERDRQIPGFNQVVNEGRSSTFWRMTFPLRFIGTQVKRIVHVFALLGSFFLYFGLFKTFLSRCFNIYKYEGFNGLRQRTILLQSNQSIADLPQYRGSPKGFLRQLSYLARALIRFERFWPGDAIRRITPQHVLRFRRCETKAGRKLAVVHFKWCIDQPSPQPINFVKESCRVAGWAVSLKTCSAGQVRIVLGSKAHYPTRWPREDVAEVLKEIGSFPVAVGFSYSHVVPYGFHRLQVELKGNEDSWIPVHRSWIFRIPHIKTKLHSSPSYGNWMCREQKILEEEKPDILRHTEVMIYKPTFTIIINPILGREGLKETIQSVKDQIYPHNDVRNLADNNGEVKSFIAEGVQELNDLSLSDIRGDFTVILESGQRLAPNALYEFANALNINPDIDMVYGDENSITPKGTLCNPFYKPDWSPDYLETFNYVGFIACFRTKIARGCFDQAHLYDFILKFTERTTKVLHVNKILGHVIKKLGFDVAKCSELAERDIAALSGRLDRTGRSGNIMEHGRHKGCYRIMLNLTRMPLVSLIIPTAGKIVAVEDRQIDLIQNVITHIRERSTYKNIEIVVVDNGDLSSDQIGFLADVKCKRVTFSEPVFNLAKKINLGAAAANGELLLLMSDDLEIITPSWIEKLIQHFEKPHVGVVGAKLLYPSKETQHVGVVHNFGNPDHVRRLYQRDEAGYFFSTCGVRNYSGVTGACMATPTRVFREVGGYSQELAVSFNDVDYCQKVQRLKLWVLYEPGAEIIHMESQSGKAYANPEEVAFYHKRWRASTAFDPYYNEHFLTVAPPTFEPRINRKML